MVVTEAVASRDLALRMPWFVTAAAYALVFIYAVPRLATDRIETARVEGVAARESQQRPFGPGSLGLRPRFWILDRFGFASLPDRRAFDPPFGP